MNLSDPGVWSAVIAAIALVLSQLPPITTLIARPRIRLFLPERLWLSHWLGTPFVVALITVENLSARKQAVARMDGWLVERSADTGRIMSAQTHILQTGVALGQAPSEPLFVGVRLKPEEIWSGTIRFAPTLSDESEERISEIIAELGRDLSDKNPSLPAGFRPRPADGAVVLKAINFFDRHFDLRPGTYQFIIAAFASTGAVLDIQGMEFKLFERTIALLRETTDQYQYGVGVFSSSPEVGNPGLRSRPIPSTRAWARYKQLIKDVRSTAMS